MKSFFALPLAAAFALALTSASPQRTRLRRFGWLLDSGAKNDVSAASATVMNTYDALRRISLGQIKMSDVGSQVVQSFGKLETQMFNKGLQNTVQVIQLYSALEEAEAKVDSTNRKGLDAVRKRIQTNVDGMVRKWADAIGGKKPNAYADAVQLAKSHPKALLSVMSSLIPKTYDGKLYRMEPILVFLKSIGDLEVQIAGYAHLAFQMYQKGHFDSAEVFQLAYRIKSAYADFRFAKMSSSTKAQLDLAKGKLPKNVQEIVLKGKNCKVKNADFKTFLYADPDTKDSMRRYDYLWYKPTETKRGDHWTFETKNEGKSWIVKNNYYKEYLIAESSRFNSYSNRRWTFLYKNANRADANWNLSIIPGVGKHVAFRNEHRNKEYMYADGKHVRDSRRRTVYTWEKGQPRGKMWEESKWDVICSS